MKTFVLYSNRTKQYYYINRYFLLIILDNYKELVGSILKDIHKGPFPRSAELCRKTLLHNEYFTIMKFWGGRRRCVTGS